MAVSINTQAEVLALVNNLKAKITIATAVVMIKFARTEGIPATEYTRNFQEEYLKNNQDKIKPTLEQRFVGHCQDDILNKLKKAVPAPAHQPNVRQERDEQLVVDGGSLDWFDDWTTLNAEAVEEQFSMRSAPCFPLSETRYNNLLSSEKFTLKNIEFVESIMRLSEESERKTTIPVSILQSLLYDEADSMSQPEHLNSYWDNNKKQPSEDSGIGSQESERLPTNSSKINYISGGVIKYLIQTSNCKQLVLVSMRSVASYVKNEIKTKPVNVLSNWKGSLVEYACDILRECSKSNSDLGEVFLNLIFDMIEDVWSGSIITQHRQLEMKILLTKEFLTLEISYEVLHYISEKLDYFIKCFLNKSHTAPLIAEKLCSFLNLYSSICVTTKSLKIITGLKSGARNVNSKEDCVTKLWQEKWCEENVNDDDEDFISMVKENGIKTLERLVLTLSSRYPLMAMLAMETLEKTEDLFRSNEVFSQDSLL